MHGHVHEEPGPGECGSGSCCTTPAGESPVRVSAGAPGSRPPAGGEIPLSEAGCRKPLRREQGCGPQHEVNPAASTDVTIREPSRSCHGEGHVVRGSPEPAVGPGGVWGAARIQGVVGNRRGPSARPESGRGVPYKPKAKSGAAQRESEGIVVPWIATANNVAGGKGPWGGCVVGAGKREGMAAKSGSNDPAGRRPRVKVRQPRWRLWTAAKRPAGGRFSTLYDPSRGVTSCGRRGGGSTRRRRNAAVREATGKPCAGNPHARFERGSCANQP